MSELKSCYFVDLFVRKSNEAAINMYSRLGYSVYREVIDYYSSGEPAPPTPPPPDAAKGGTGKTATGNFICTIMTHSMIFGLFSLCPRLHIFQFHYPCDKQGYYNRVLAGADLGISRGGGFKKKLSTFFLGRPN